MKVLVFSDTHLSTEFDGQLFDYISNLINSVDQVIINGDFWDWYLCSFDDFVNSEWQQLFPLLKAKNTIYLYGNHDPEAASDERVSLFSVKQGYSHRVQLDTGLEYHIEHGHRITPEFDATHPRLTKVLGFLYPRYLLLNQRQTRMGKISRKMRWRRCQRMLGEVRAYLRQKNDFPLMVCGHIHDQSDERQSSGFVCTGPFWQGVARYAIIDDHNLFVQEEPYASA